MPIFKRKNKSFFKKWTPDMAYVLGFFAADGYMVKNKRGGCYIDFYSNDRDVIEKIKRVTLASQKITSKTRKGVLSYRLQIGSKQWFQNLSALGLMQAKSLKIRLPKIPKEYLAHFVRGYFDGDGCVSFGFYSHNVGRKKYPTITTRFTSGSKLFLKDLHKELGKFTLGGYIYEKVRKGKTIGYELVFSLKDSVALFQLMYYNISSSMYLNRKLDIFKKAFKTLQIAGVA